MSRGPEPSYMVPITADDGDAIALVPVTSRRAAEEWLVRLAAMMREPVRREPERAS